MQCPAVAQVEGLIGLIGISAVRKMKDICVCCSSAAQALNPPDKL
jgi:hypothetical protein